jgi:pyruvate,water dikinase
MEIESNIIHLNSKKIPEISEVGGKGHSLIKLSSLNLNVPNGIILTVNYFQDWIKTIENSDLYNEFITILQQNKIEKDEACSEILNKIKTWCLDNLKLNKNKKSELDKNIKSIFPNDFNKLLYAVRSSSPEEDLSGASFAGNYETYLGIKYDSLEKYILKSFISCLDYRVFKYKIEKGFNVSEIKIAIVIMKQINCDASGVGFSINPISNDYDEAVITSNFGLGESVVGGIITPDEYIVNKLNKKIISRKLGSKEKIVKLNKEENETSIIEQNKDMKKESSLKDELIIKIVETIIFIEKSYEIPIDIEFGIEKNILYILQARPITTYNKIPKELLTKPNEKRQLYFDGTLGVQGFEKPMSTMGASIIKKLGHYFGIKILGSYNLDNIKEGIVDGLGGKLLLNISNIITKIDIKSLSSFGGNINRVIPEVLNKYGEKYKNEKMCYEIDVSILGMAWRLPIKRILFYNFFAQSTKENFDYYFEEFTKINDKFIDDNLNSDLPLTTIVDKILDELSSNFRDYLIPIIFLGMVKGYTTIRKLFEETIKNNPELNEDLNNLTKGLPFVTVKMGLELYELTKFFDKIYYKSKTSNDFYNDYMNKKFPKKFYTDFDLFMKKYGFRGEWEFDIKNSRYDENPKIIINQIYSSLLNTDENKNPKKDFDEVNAKRPEVFQKLLKIAKDKGFSSEFEEAYNLMINYFYYRESPKYYIVYCLSKIRKLILHRANILLKNNLIDDINDIFKLNIDTLSSILSNVNKYNKEQILQIIKRDNYLNEIFNSWKRFPLLFDSRGRLFFQEKKISNKKNELIGDTVSFGKIRGKAKVLLSLDEKKFNPGEILITKATDPGWTPLIINCGGIVLEVGGMLQHGALVSREFNKPCVVGIDNVTNIIKDGEEVEVDAIEGVVRLLDREE